MKIRSYASPRSVHCAGRPARRSGAPRPAPRCPARSRFAARTGCAAAVALDEHGSPRRPARAPRSPSAPVPANRSRTRSPSSVAEHREQRLADPLGGRPGPPSCGAFSRRPPMASRDDPHRRNRSGCAASAPTCAQPVLVASAAAPKRRSSSSPSSACSGDAQLRVRGHDRLGPRPGPLEQLRILGQASDLELAKPGLTRADQLALAAQLQVDLGERGTRRSARPGPAAARMSGGPTQETARRGARRARRARAADAVGRCRSARRSRSASPSRWGRRCRPRSRWWRRARRRLPEAKASIASCFSRGRIAP